jgi:hypothetical protein|tara:strand:- start:2490 stop:3272 length:783 start_codon:yes stop_codon:yes gene_type:complete
MGLINYNLVKDFFTNNQSNKLDKDGKSYTELTPVKYRWTHGATDKYLGDGLLVYSIIQFMKYKTCVCLGSGGGFIPRIISQARLDLHDVDIFDGSKAMEYGDCGTTILVDANNGVNGKPDWIDNDSFFRKSFPCRIILETTETAYYNYFVKEDIKIDYLHIDAGHSFEDVERDFNLYSKRLNEGGMIAIHDTDKSYEVNHIIPNDIDEKYHQTYSFGPNMLIKELQKNKEWEVFNFFNHKPKANHPSSTGLTFLQKRKIR